MYFKSVTEISKILVEIPRRQAALGQHFFFFNLFHVDHCKVFIEFVTILLLGFLGFFLRFGFLVTRHMEFQSLDQGLNPHPCIGRQSLNPWTTREVSGAAFLLLYLLGTVYYIVVGIIMDWKGRVGSLDWVS